jgi:hypothetical protein
MSNRARVARNLTSISRSFAMASRANSRDRKILYRGALAAQFGARDRKFYLLDEEYFPAPLKSARKT